MTRLSKSSGALSDASTPIMALTECPTNTASRKLQFTSDFHEVVGIAVKRSILRRIVGAEIRLSGANMIEENRSELAAELRLDEAPHVLIAAETMGKHHLP